jgi:D-beta-D-heptose 7-phosphate kinase/D-beta-D-heptose 1-phosphate adenosyltransferase
MTTTELRKVISSFSSRRVLVVGDVMLDQFLWGKVSRISPEAPVPVVEVVRESFFPGGAANVARNLRALGGQVSLLGVTGDDAAGIQLRALLQERGIETDAMLTDPSRPTTLKTRIVAHHQQVVRFDRESTAPLSAALAAEAMAAYRRLLTEVDAVIFEDYSKGFLDQALLNKMQQLAVRKRLVTTADPNSRHPLRFTRLTAVTPNRSEAFACAGLPYREPVDDVLTDQPLMEVGKRLLAKWQVRNLLVTLGEHGMCLFRKGKRPHHIPTVAQEVFDVSGAGDTVIATLTMALASRADPVVAADLSNHAAGVVVGKVGTATCTPDELIHSYNHHRR